MTAVRRAGRATSVQAIGALCVLALLAAACGAHVDDGADPEAERITRLADQRDALQRRVEALELQLANASTTALQPRPPAYDAAVVSRTSRITVDGVGDAVLELCLQVTSLDVVSADHTLSIVNDACQSIALSASSTDTNSAVLAVLSNERFRCWSDAAVGAAVPACWWDARDRPASSSTALPVTTAEPSP